MTKTYSTSVQAPTSAPAVDTCPIQLGTYDDVLPNPTGRQPSGRIPTWRNTFERNSNKAGDNLMSCKI